MLKRYTAGLLALLLVISWAPTQAQATQESVPDETESYALNDAYEDGTVEAVVTDLAADYVSYAEDAEFSESPQLASARIPSPGEMIDGVGSIDKGDVEGEFSLLSDANNVNEDSNTREPSACGTNLYWTYDEESSALVISGSGAMDNYDGVDSMPWYAYMDSISSITICDGVTSIGDYAFFGAMALREISIPFGLESIGHYAFYDCSALETVVLPDSITSLGYCCFAACASLWEINLPLNWSNCPSYSGEMDADHCGHIFQDCTSLSSVIVPDGITKLPSFAFAYCNYLTSIILPNSLTALPSQAFFSCVNLVDVKLPEAVASIGKSAFCYCSSLETVMLPSTVVEIKNYAFFGCSSLTDIEIPDGVASIGDMSFYECSSLKTIALPKAITEISYFMFSRCNSLTDIEIPEEVVTIREGAFCYCSSLADIEFPDSVVKLESYAFYECTSLTKVQLPDGVASIGYQCFYGCTNLSDINIPQSWVETPSVASDGTMSTDYCGRIFEGCTSLKSLVVPEGMTLPSFALAYSDFLETVILPSTATEIKNHTFYGCSKLIDVDMPEGVTFIGKSAFCYCSSLETIHLPNTLVEIKAYAFYNCSKLVRIEVPEGVTTIGKEAFGNCTNLETATLPSTISEIEEFTFYKCSSLKKVVISKGVRFVGKAAFCYCNSLTDILVPDGVEKLELYAFYECTSLTEVQLPDSVTSIGYQCFYGCDSLYSINIPRNWTECPSSATDGTENSKYCGHIFQGCSRLKRLVIPEGVVTLPAYALCYSDYLETVVLPSTATEIKNHTFYGCTSLKEVEIPEGITSIGKSAFCYCSSLTEIRIPDGVEKLELFAFYKCTSLTEVQLSDSITSIGYQCFYGCDSLYSINIPRNWTEVPSSSTDGTISPKYCGHIFEGCTSLKSLVIPEGVTLPAYALCYSDYLETVILPNTATEIKNYTFYGCARMTEISIPETVTEIGAYAYNGCKALTAVVIPNSVTGIGYHAFADCVNLTEVVLSSNWTECLSNSDSGVMGVSYCGGIFYGCSSLLTITVPEGVATIPEYAFANCKSLISVKLPSSLTAIPAYAFYGCTDLMSIAIPEGVNIISNYAFSNCSNLIVVNIPASTIGIEYQAFYRCSSVQQVNYAGTEEDWLKIEIDTHGNSALTEQTINCGFQTKFSREDLLKVWEGEYDGNHGAIIVRRHFVAVIEECSEDGIISGKVTFSPSEEVSSKYSANGSYYFSGVADIQTGLVFLQGHTWIEYPAEYDNFQFVTFDGVLSSDKGRIAGINDGDCSRTFYACSIGTSQTTNTRVTLSRNSELFDLLKDKVSLLKMENEEVTITVIPDWQNSAPGVVRLFQGNTVIESKTGVFVDIVPSQMFSPLESIFVSMIDSSGNAIETRKLSLKIELPTATRLDADLKEMSLTVYENRKGVTSRTDQYVLSVDAKVIASGITYTTNSKGTVKIPNVTEGSITVEKEGYSTRTITAEQLKNSKVVILQKESEEAPIISAVWYEDKDALSQTCAIDFLSTEESTLLAEIDWGYSSLGSVALAQGATTIQFSSTTITTVLSENFDLSEPIYIVATNADGKATKKELLFKSDASGIPEWLKFASFSIDDEISVTLPETIKPEFFAGQEIEVDAGSTMIPVTISAEDGKVYVAIGVKMVSYSNDDMDIEAKDFVTKLKNLDIWDTSEDMVHSLYQFLQLKQTYKSAIKSPEGSFGFEAKYNILGFAEGYYNAKGDVVFLDAGVILNPYVSVSTSLPFTVGPVPMFFEAELSADIVAQLNLIFKKAAKSFMPNGQLSGTITLEGGVGVGMDGVLYASGGLAGNLHPDWRIYYNKQDYFKLSASVNAYAKVGIACFEFKKSWDPFYNEVWVEIPKTGSSAISLFEYDDLTNYEVKDLTYLDAGTQFMQEDNLDRAGLMSTEANEEYLSIDLKKTNIYRESTPQFVTFENGTKLVVWTDACTNNVNDVVLYYSYYDGYEWSNPSPIHSDGTFDYTPKMTVINDTAYLVWQNATREFDATEGLDDIAPFFDISLAVFDPVTGFKVSTISSEGLDMMPTLCSGDDGSVFVAWVSNTESDWLGESLGNNILYSRYQENSFGTIVTAYSNLNAVHSIAIDYHETLLIAYCVDEDGDVTTCDDVRLYKNGERVSAAEMREASPRFVNHALYWLSNGAVFSEAGDEACEIVIGSRYQVVENGDNKAIVYTASNGLSSTLMVTYFNEETNTWCESIPLSDGTNFIGAFSASILEDGTLEVFANSQEITGDFGVNDPYGEATLVLLSRDFYCDLTMGELVYSADSYSAGDAMELAFELTNSGSQTIKSVTITVSDEEGNPLSCIKMDDLLVPGQTITSSTYFNVDPLATGQDIVVTVEPDEMFDVNHQDNFQRASLGFEDLSVEQTSWGMAADGVTVIFANIVNYGYSERTDIVVELREGSVDGNLVDSIVIPTLDVLSLETVAFEVLTQTNDVYYVSIRNSGDPITANDYDFVPVLKTARVTIESITENNVQVYLKNNPEANCIVAVYNAEGRMLTCGVVAVGENAGTVTIPYTGFPSDVDCTVKAFLLDSSCLPICESDEIAMRALAE